MSVSTPPAAPETVEIVRFLHRFADLMSTGANSDNLLRAARLLEAQVDKVRESNELLQVERVRSDARSEPASGSVSDQQPSFFPCASGTT